MRIHFGEWLANTDDEALSDYFIFSVTRNPWDRFLSTSEYEDAIEFVRDVYELDIKYFGYEFEAPVNKRCTRDRSPPGKFVRPLNKLKVT